MHKKDVIFIKKLLKIFFSIGCVIGIFQGWFKLFTGSMTLSDFMIAIITVHVVLFLLLKSLGINVSQYIPNRIKIYKDIKVKQIVNVLNKPIGNQLYKNNTDSSDSNSNDNIPETKYSKICNYIVNKGYLTNQVLRNYFSFDYFEAKELINHLIKYDVLNNDANNTTKTKDKNYIIDVLIRFDQLQAFRSCEDKIHWFDSVNLNESDNIRNIINIMNLSYKIMNELESFKGNHYIGNIPFDNAYTAFIRNMNNYVDTYIDFIIKENIDTNKNYESSIDIMNKTINDLYLSKDLAPFLESKLNEKINFIENKIEEIESYYSDLLKTYDHINDGFEFEKFIANVLNLHGYDASVTQASNDYGVDVIAFKDNIKYAIQCKYYSGSVGVDAVKEVIAGRKYYNCHVGVVATNSFFTHNAKYLAESNYVVLWDGDYIKKTFIISENKQ